MAARNAMRQNNNNTGDPWHISGTSSMQQHQERLILLHHARKCPHDDENEDSTTTLSCPVTPQCAEAKRIWKHIAECKHKKCPYCYSSRWVLTHYRECNDGMCQICGPVREEIIRKKKQQQQGLVVLKTDTFSTSMTPSTHPSTSTPRLNNTDTRVAVTPTTNNPMPTLTVAICRSANNVGRIIPVRMRSFSSSSGSSISSLSHSERSSTISSSRSSARSSRSNGSRLQYSVCIGGGRCRSYPTCGGIKCRENLGIAHFCKQIKE